MADGAHPGECLILLPPRRELFCGIELADGKLRLPPTASES
jgi:hypothetical protein